MQSRQFNDLLNIPGLPAYLKNLNQALLAASSSELAIQAATTRAIQSGGKRLRPSLLFATAKLGKADVSGAVALGTAVEFAHLASIVHDDIIDRAPIRHGQPSTPKATGMDQAILVGDYLLATSIGQSAKVNQVTAQTIAAAVQAMIEGQSMELADKFNTNRTLDDYREVIHKKTGALFAAACQLGGQSAGLSALDVKAVTRYGELFGVSFQLIDDLLDFTSSSKLAGKPVGNDIVEGNFTLPVLLSLQGPHAKELRGYLKNPATSKSQINKLLIKDGSFPKTIDQINTINQKATASLSHFNDSPVLAKLKNFPADYTKWILKRCAAKRYQSILSED